MFDYIKYRFKRFSRWFFGLFSVLIVLSSLFVFSASAEVSSILTDNVSFTASQYITDTDNDVVYSSPVDFFPGDNSSATINPVANKPIGIVFSLTDTHSTGSNNFKVSSGVLNLKMQFTTTVYFTSDAPTIWFHFYDEISGNGESFDILPDSYSFSMTNKRVGSQSLWIVDVDIKVSSDILPRSTFREITFEFTRAKAPTTNEWVLTSRSFSAEMLTGADVPKYTGADIDVDSLTDAEADLKGDLSSSSDFDDYLSTSTINPSLLAGIRFVGDFIGDFLSLDSVFNAFVKMLLGIGMCAFCINVVPGVVKSIASRSNKDTKGK